MSNEYFRDTFLKSAAIVRNQFSLEVVTRKWNATGLGKLAGESTIDRWLSVGPDTKNPRFEPWIIGLASLYL